MANKIKIEFPDGNSREYDNGITGFEVAMSIGERLAQAALAIIVNGQTVDLSVPITKDSKVSILTFDSPEGKEVFWHSTSHVLAQAVKRLYPDAKPTIGPAIEQGFYYDFDMPPLSPKDLEAIETEMKKIIKENFVPERIDYKDEAEAKKEFGKNPYKVELIEKHEEKGSLSAYKQGEFIDLCRGPHLPKLGKIKALKLTKVSASYWRADANNASLQRIYGISFPDKKFLKEYLRNIEEAEKRNHRKVGKDLELFEMFEEAPGMPFFLPNGTVLWNEIEGFVRDELFKRDYVEVRTPLILNKELWLKSGHWDNYKENMYFQKIDNQDYALKPMNCPGHVLLYRNKTRSYRELPMRMAEFGIVHRHELSGVLYGLLRVRKFTQDDAHVFCTPNQLEDEIIACIDFTEFILSTFGFKYKIELSTRPDKSVGTDEMWEKAESSLRNALGKKKLDFQINEGDGAFYGPKIDFHVIDTLGRSWQLTTIQVDFSMPERFDLNYMGEDGTNTHRPVMIHRAILGSVERFIGILIEQYGGKFPLWIAPEQVAVCTVADRFSDYANKVRLDLKAKGFRVKMDTRAESIPKKIREAQLRKIPYICVVGENEEVAKTISFRTRDNEVHGPIKLEEFYALLEKVRQERS